MIIHAPILLLLSWLLSACQPMERAEVMSEVTFRLEYPAEMEWVKLSYQLSYSNHNTGVNTIRNSITSATYQDQLLRGLYTIHVEGTAILRSGEVIQVRGVESDQLFLDSHNSCGIKLIRMP